jgi:hypothetical protein
MNAPCPHHDDRRLLLIFVDGLGVSACPDPERNPLQDQALHLLGLVPRLADGAVAVPGFAARSLDATLGVPGLPQSATGQATLFTGVNAAELAGRHVNAFPNAELRGLLRRESIFLQLARRGVPGEFANTFSPELMKFYLARRLSVTSWAVLAGGRLLRTFPDQAAGRAVYQDFTNLFLQVRGYDVPLQTPAAAGGTLAGLAAGHPFLLYEYFMTDHAGHTGDPAFARLILRLLDAFLEALLAGVDPAQTTVLLTSDHGNIEDLDTRSHTTNPVPLLVWGHDAGALADRIGALTDVTPAIVEYLAGEPTPLRSCS